MVHTANLMVSGGMAGTEFPGGAIVPESAAATRSTARKSQIIEEEEDAEDEEIEEVDAFSGPEEEPSSPTVRKAADGKPSLAPAPDIHSSPSRPPRSSSLRAARPSVVAESTDEDDQKDNASLTPVASAK